MMRRAHISIRGLCFGLMIAFAFAPAVARAQSPDITIPGGTDYLYTQPGTFGIFPPPLGTVPLVGDPIYAGGSDTVVQRNGDADATTGVPITTQLTGLALSGPGGLTVSLDPAHLADDMGTMSFLVNSPTVPGTEVTGTITDTLTVYYQVTIPGVGSFTGKEDFTSTGTWEALLSTTTYPEVTDFKIILDVHVDPSGGQHIVSSFAVPEPSTWVMLAAAGLIVPAYTLRRGRRRA